MGRYRKRRGSERLTKTLLFIASLAVTASFGLVTPDQNTPWLVVVGFCFSLQITLIMVVVAIPSPPDPRERTHKSIFRGWLLPDEEEEERGRQREKDSLGFDAPDGMYQGRRR